jgi:hypothetical protein
MSTGILARGNISSADTNTTIYTVPAGKTVTFTVSVCNRNTVTINASIALSTSDTPSNEDYIEYNAEIAKYEVLERSAIIAGENTKLVVRSNTANTSVVIWGFEE